METAFGCSRCRGDDAAAAWTASRATRLRSLIEESHFSVQLTACRCGQRFATVFTERVDWSGGEDAQDWLMLPLTRDEATTTCTGQNRGECSGAGAKSGPPAPPAAVGACDAGSGSGSCG